MSIDPLAFNDNQQAAIIYHAINRPGVFEVLDKIQVSKEWFSKESVVLGDLWSYIQKFRDAYKKNPVSFQEVIANIKDEVIVKQAAQRIADFCDRNGPLYQWDVLEGKLVEWSKAIVVRSHIEELAPKFNEGKLKEAFDLFEKGALELQKQSSVLTPSMGTFISSAQRVRLEKERRLKEHERILPYGITYLQDCLNGILPSDMVLLAADTGVGKTEAAKILAAHVAEEKKLPVHFFALEAEENEIEMRIKYGLMAGWYRDDHVNIPEGMITYANWRYNRLNNEFAPYEKRVEDYYDQNYSTLYTHYGSITHKELEQKIYQVKDDSALVVLDHLHYMDLGENENRDMTYLVKGLRELNQTLNVPFILVCHVRKGDKRFGSKQLVPDRGDIHGSSNISKICTQAIMLSPAWGFVSVDKRAAGKPTFIRLLKVRVDGSAIYHTGIGFFDTYKAEYTPYYTCGHLSPNSDKWEPSFGNWPYWANPERLIVDCGEIK